MAKMWGGASERDIDIGDAVVMLLLQLLMRCASCSEGVVYKGEMMRDMRHGTGAR